MAFEVADLSALEILDLRALPTLAVSVRLEDGTIARAGVPSGASTGSREAVERRDGDQPGTAARACSARSRRSTASWPTCCGAVVGVAGRGRPGDDRPGRHGDQEQAGRERNRRECRWRWPARWPPRRGAAVAVAEPRRGHRVLPVPHFNVLNGGVHAPNQLDFQEFMIAPLGAPSMAEAVRAGAEVYAALRRELSARKLSDRPGRRGRLRARDRRARGSAELLVRPSATPGTARARRGIDRAGPGRL